MTAEPVSMEAGFDDAAGSDPEQGLFDAGFAGEQDPAIDFDADLPDHRPAADELLDTARELADLHRALMLLNAQTRQLAALAFFEGWSHEEIASETSLPLATEKSQIRRALISLRQTLGERCLDGMGKMVRAAVPAATLTGLRL